MTTLTYWSRQRRQFLAVADEDAIAVPDAVRAAILAAQQSGKKIDCLPDGTPFDVAALTTLAGMRAAVFREMKEQRALILNALTGVGYDALRSGDAALASQVDAARLFLRNIPSDSDLLAVTPEGGGWQAMRTILLAKWTAYARAASPAIRGAFAEIA